MTDEEEREALDALAAAARALLGDGPFTEALAGLARAAGEATGSDVVVARTASAPGRELVARAVWAESGALAAELQGSQLAPAEVPPGELEAAGDDRRLPEALRRAAERARAEVVALFPLFEDEEPVATLELLRAAAGLSGRERALARLAAAQLGLAVRRGGADGAAPDGRRPALELLGEALAAGADELETAEHIVQHAAVSLGAAGAALWRTDADAAPELLAAHGFDAGAPDLAAAGAVAELAVRERRRGYLPEPRNGSVAWPGAIATLPLGEPPVGALQLYFADDGPPVAELELLAPFAAHVALALRRSGRVKAMDTALRRSETVVGVVGQAIARLSLAHTLETAVERIAELTSSDHVAIYLREGERLTAAAARGLTGSHTDLAERLLELALGPFRGRGFLFVEDMSRDARLPGVEPLLAESGIRRALLIPLIVHDEVTGALAVFQTRPRPYRAGEEGLLIALSSQLAVAVQNARLHERTKELGATLERALLSERRSARQLRGLYDISHSFAESLSLQATLDAVAKTMVELFELDAAAIRMPDARGEALETRAIHVADAKLRDVAPAILARPQPVSAPPVRRLLRSRRPVLLTPGNAGDSDAHRLLEPFLRQGSTAAVLPLATPGETLGTLTLLSLDPARPLERDTVEAAMRVAGQAALAIDNARLHQQQKDFSETMQRSLLPRRLPAVAGLDVGHVYQSSARVDVGGDVYDFLPLEHGRLAVVLGDVTGKGIQAAADMALAKFSFRALARLYPDPSDFLAQANEVVVEEIGVGKFITMLYVLADGPERTVACASAGHPPVRVVDPDGTVSELAARGLALGIESGQEYPAERAVLAPGATVVLYTDGVIEARRDGDLYGEERLDALLARRAGIPAQELAEAILADCRSFAGGDVGDDCAVVCLRLAP